MASQKQNMARTCRIWRNLNDLHRLCRNLAHTKAFGPSCICSGPHCRLCRCECAPHACSAWWVHVRLLLPCYPHMCSVNALPWSPSMCMYCALPGNRFQVHAHAFDAEMSVLSSIVCACPKPKKSCVLPCLPVCRMEGCGACVSACP